MTSEKQTLILAGESVPPRGDAGSQLKRVTMLLVQGEYGAPAPTVTVESIPAAAPADYRGLSAGAAQYARTQNLSGARARRPIIDTYA